MRTLLLFLTLAVANASLSSCSVPTKVNIAAKKAESSIFSLMAMGDVEVSSLVGIEDALQKNYARITQDLGITGLPEIVVKVWSDPVEFKAVFEREGGRGGVTRGYVNTELMEVRVLDGDGVEAVAVHEFAHVAMLAVNPTIAANPFWLWEAVALYEDGSGPPDALSLSCISSLGSPSLAELNEYPGNTKIFRMGFLLADYIVENWDRSALVALIQNNGDIERSLGVSQENFERDWLTYVLATRDFSVTQMPMTKTELVDRFSGNTLTSEQLNLSTFMAKDGRFVYGSGGAVQAEGRWAALDSDELCLKLGVAKLRCSRWYDQNGSTYRLASNSDCAFQDWELSLGDSQGFGSD